MSSLLRSFSLPSLILLAAVSATGQRPVTSQPVQQRIVQPVDNSRLTRLSGSVHPAIRSATDLGPVDPALPMERVQLVLQRSPESQAAFDAYTESQYDPASPNYHRWLSPDQIGTLFGIADADLAKVTGWLQSQGFTVNSVSRGRLTIDFSGTAAQIQTAFHTQIHNFSSPDGEQHIANITDPSIPQALAPVVVGLLSLHNFFPKSNAIFGPKLTRDAATHKFSPVAATDVSGVPTAASLNLSRANPLFTGTPPGTTNQNGYYVSPYDFATIYNSLPTWTAGNTGAGTSIAIVGRSEIVLSDVATFQSEFGLPDNPPTIIHNGPSPGVLTSSGDQGENTLDVEWSSAAAPGAKVNLVISKSTGTSDGGVLSELYVVDNQVAPIMSASYGDCEFEFGTSGNAFYNSLWQQAAAEGISVFISSGDQDAAVCDIDGNQNAAFATQFGLAVNGIASPPYVTAVGGTDFNDYSTASTYWNSTNAANGSSAKGYIPELPWNDSCANPAFAAANNLNDTPSQLCNLVSDSANIASNGRFLNNIGGSGGVSACTTNSGSTVATCSGGYAKPSWQIGTGVPADGKRDVPDVSLFASNGFLGNAYIFVENGIYYGVGGTSVSSPAMAGLMALIVHKQGAAQGLANPALYKLFGQETLGNCNSSTVANGNSCVFYDTTYGNIVAPCKAGSPNCVTTPSDPNYTQYGILSGDYTTAGYDLASGLGSVNVTNLVNGWNSVAPVPATTTVTVTPATLSTGTIGTAYYQPLSGAGGTPPYSYYVSSGSLPPWMTLTPDGVLTGVPTALTPYSFTITARDSSLHGPFAGSQAYSQVVVGASLSNISWLPARISTYSGLVVGTDVLNATSIPASTFTYTYTLANDGSPVQVLATTVLLPGTYTLTASSSLGGSAAIPFTVIPEHVWIVNSSGTLVGLDAGGNNYAVPTGGGFGIGIDNSGTISSGNTSGTALTTFSNTGTAFAAHAAIGGISSPSGIAIDGNGYIWTANANNSVSAVSPSGTTALSPATGFTGGSISTPSGIAIDISGNVWISNSGNSSVTEILGGAAPVEPLATAQTQRNLGAKP
jgi:subtilase family serine protease